MATSPHRIAVLGLPDVVGFDLAIPSQIFGGARDAAGEQLYAVQVCSLDGGPISTTKGFAVLPSAGPEHLRSPDTLIIPGTHLEGPRTDGSLDPELADYLAGLPARTRIMSICTGAFVLAAAGMLDGRPATTHWAYAEDFRRLYPEVDLDPDVLFVDDGDVLTSAGVAAGIDLCLHVIRRDHGSEVANRAARSSVVPPWREGGQAQYIERPVPEPDGNGTSNTRAWLLRNLAEPLTLDKIAAHAGTSVRTFTRRFRDETGSSPMDWLLRQRLEHARHLLESTDLPIDAVAEQAGLSTAASLRKHLRHRLGTSPATYRRTFRS
ncbi:Transcriptional regulator GlxA family, contains an amidase domain and an AraC-type DNA-binding HTH domain [Saccharopolyspora antimicrobica]|uniref:AraC family transcriptional regulator with amidase-like domain n=1 Tax=Saccharopolyspora antimicrobica TaxID=455193 RepID=A0A1I5BFS8_9PSEU|nr:helix-turn-helix domain-containing protein [Saccharopolyspora antimicrobica]RKT86597.1 AraC family transcriptional regulator with amidase-like domain [Saccharopolyspora antimicrobica]SFN73526.1 Transcriptional regulator GlxA family, contains an amidase domain and an AraC-type DNA-binding HTH domain [Saccharopolyspora antimicrobica]